jgi:hypothetical protein
LHPTTDHHIISNALPTTDDGRNTYDELHRNVGAIAAREHRWITAPRRRTANAIDEGEVTTRMRSTRRSEEV